jgi:PLP dependent protein
VSDIRERLARVRDRIANAARRARRDPASVRLVAVSKTFPTRDIRAAFEEGQRDFGENKVQEALQKIDATKDLDLVWHLVGHLQSNKAKKAGASFAVIHSIDGVDLLKRLDEAASNAGRRPQLLVQVDLAGEATKHGARADELGGIFEAARQLKAARLIGLMLLPPATEDPEGARQYFTALHRLRDDLAARGVDRTMLRELSMGMSHDFEVAVEEGATIVRVGSAIFGERHYEQP